MRNLVAVVAAVGTLGALASTARGVEPLPKKLRGIDVHEHLGKQVDAQARFTDHNGKSVRLADYLDGERPVLLTLNYYRCRTLCSIQLNALTRALKGLEWTPGKNYRVVTISIDHREKPKLAASKRKSYLAELGRGQDVGWSFLVGQEPMIRRVARSVGFVYRYDPEQDQYAHPAVIAVLSPKGKISRYIYGLELRSRDIKFALIDASDGKVGSTVDKLILSCFHYNADEGRYGAWAFGIMRLAGVATLLVLSIFLAILWRRDRRRRATREEAAARDRLRQSEEST